MTMEINFTDRESYLAWRANWRAVYKMQSQEIREIKAKMSEAYKNANFDKASRLQSTLHYERKIATRLMETLEEAKAHSKAIRESQKQAA